MIRDASDKALRTFVTGLTGSLGRILYAANPSTLPEAYAKLQTIANDQERIKFANQYNQPQVKQEPTRINPNFQPKSKKPFQNPNFKSYGGSNNKSEPIDVDKSSMHVNVDKGENRPRSNGFSHQNTKKVQRVNQLLENEEVNANDFVESENGCHDEFEATESEDEVSLVFLDK